MGKPGKRKGPQKDSRRASTCVLYGSPELTAYGLQLTASLFTAYVVQLTATLTVYGLHAYMFTWCMFTCLHTYMRTRLHALAYMLHAYMPLFAYTSLYGYMLTCLHAYLRVHVGSEQSKKLPDPYGFWGHGARLVRQNL